MPSLAEKLIKQGEERGKIEGEKRGEIKGTIKGKQDLLLSCCAANLACHLLTKR